MSTYGDHGRPIEDLTARARILDAALVQFAKRGVGRTTMRSVAEAAGVSVGSIQHHFGTKDGLRRACDDRVLAYLRVKVTAEESGGGLADPDVIGVLYDAATPVVPYLARVALEADERAAVLFDEITAVTAAWLVDRWPDRFEVGAERSRDAAAAMVAMSMSITVLDHQLVRVMDLAPDEPSPSPRVGMAVLDAFRAMGEYLDSPSGAGLRDAVETYYERTMR